MDSVAERRLASSRSAANAYARYGRIRGSWVESAYMATPRSEAGAKSGRRQLWAAETSE